jgi:hypothetical protein
MKRLLLPATLLSLTLALTGCLEFKEQTLTFRLDTAHDTLRIFQVYHGICGTKGEELTDEEKEQLNSVLTTERTFFFTNWVYEISKEQIRDGLAKLRAPKPAGSDAEPGPNDYTEEELKRVERLGDLVMQNVRIENGTLYFDDQHRLCGTQKVTLSKWSELLAAGNAALRDMMRHELEEDKEMNAEEKAALLTQLDQVQNFLQVRENGLTITLPVPRKRFQDLTENRSADELDMLNTFKRAGGKLTYSDTGHVMTIAFTAPQGSLTTLTLPVSTATYSDNAVAPLKEKQQVIKETHDPAKEMGAFLK